MSDEEFDCCKKSEGKPVQTNIDDELHLLPKDNKLTPGQGTYKGRNKTTEPQTSVRRSNRLPFAKQTEKLGGVPYQTNNNRKKQTVNGNVLQEKTATTTRETEDENHRSVWQETKKIRTIRHYNNDRRFPHGQTRRGGNMTYADLTSNSQPLIRTSGRETFGAIDQQNSNCFLFMLFRYVVIYSTH